MCSVSLNMDTISGTAHAKMISSFSPDVGNVSLVTHYTALTILSRKLIQVFHVLTIKDVFCKPPSPNRKKSIRVKPVLNNLRLMVTHFWLCWRTLLCVMFLWEQFPSCCTTSFLPPCLCLLDKDISDCWTGRGGHISWLPRSPNLNSRFSSEGF
jgi:hypothetical protein